MEQRVLTIGETKLEGNVSVCIWHLVYPTKHTIGFKQVFSLSNEFLSHRQMNLSITETKLLQKPRGDISL